MNVEKARVNQMLSNEEIKTIITALGAGIGDEFDVSKIRYGKVILMCDADVDGSHIRTLLLTFFYRQMKEVIENEHVYIAQPPLYRVKRGKKEQYISTEKEMKEFLIEQGTEGLKVVLTKGKKEVTPKKLKDLLELLIRLEKLSSAIERRGVKLSKYLKLRDEKTKKLPIYRVNVEGEYKYLYTDDELAKVRAAEGREAEIAIEGEEETPAEGKTSTVAVQEFYEAREIEKISREIAKFGLDIAEYEREEAGKPEEYSKKKAGKKGKAKTAKAKSAGPLFRVEGGTDIFSLQELLVYILKEGERGMTIQRYKGLGEMNPEQLWETTMDPERRTLQKVTVEDATAADEMFTVLMGDNVESRREFIIDHAREVKNLDI